MRSFVAIPLPDVLRARLAGVQAESPLGRPVDEENLHLTLAFLDEVEAPLLAEIARALADEVRAAPFEVRIAGLDCFGGKDPKLVFAQVADSAALTDLHDQVRRAVRRAGLDLPRRRFRPHVTLLRLRRLQPEDQTALARFLSAQRLEARFTADRFALYSSVLMPDGPVYAELAEYPLG